MIEELPNGRKRVSLEFSEYHWQQTEAAAKKLGFADTDEMITDALLGQLAKLGINPLQDWI